jgi:REP element-mobilizing transposase RayT
MPQSLSRVLIHTIFSTKNRFPYLTNPSFRNKTHAYLARITTNLGCHPICIGGTADHAHLLTYLSRTITIASLVKELKRLSTKWIRDHGDPLSTFQWQIGYSTFSVHPSDTNQLIHYIQNQETHHKENLFQDEYRKLLTEQGIDFDEKYLWD